MNLSYFNICILCHANITAHGMVFVQNQTSPCRPWSISIAIMEIKEWYSQGINLRIRMTHIFAQTGWTNKLFGSARFNSCLQSQSGLIHMSISNNHQLFLSICLILPISVGIISLALEQTYDWPSVSQRNLRNVGTFTSGVTPVISVYCFWISKKQWMATCVCYSTTDDNRIDAIYFTSRRHDFTTSQMAVNGWAIYEDKATVYLPARARHTYGCTTSGSTEYCRHCTKLAGSTNSPCYTG